MIVYQGNLRQFSNDVLMGMIADRIEKCFKETELITITLQNIVLLIIF